MVSAFEISEPQPPCLRCGDTFTVHVPTPAARLGSFKCRSCSSCACYVRPAARRDPVAAARLEARDALTVMRGGLLTPAARDRDPGAGDPFLSALAAVTLPALRMTIALALGVRAPRPMLVDDLTDVRPLALGAGVAFDPLEEQRIRDARSRWE